MAAKTNLPIPTERGRIGDCFPPFFTMPTLLKKKKKAVSKVLKRSKVKVLKKKKIMMKKKTIKKSGMKAKPKVLGKVIHFYDRISVAIVKLISPIAVGDTVTFRRGEFAHTEVVRSMQIDHAQVSKAKKGDVVGMHVSQYIGEGALMVPLQ
jgi:hypothetical protein